MNANRRAFDESLVSFLRVYISGNKYDLPFLAALRKKPEQIAMRTRL